VQGDGEFDNAQGGAEMTAGGGNGIDRFGAQLIGDLAQLLRRKVPQIGRHAHAIQ
jgi:hypothetical protein